MRGRISKAVEHLTLDELHARWRREDRVDAAKNILAMVLVVVGAAAVVDRCFG